MAEVAPFSEFYRAVNGGRAPLPWQARLADTVVDRGWPAEIGVPTGLGKTACIDIAVWALAHSSSAGSRAPTRVWYVVNRRLLVDAGWEHARHLAGLLADPGRLASADRDAVDSVAGALASIQAFGGEAGPLHVARLRGGADLGARSPDPSQPCLFLATVPMFASRWMFRGYGSSTSMRPIDAAHAGIDSLVLLDEAHLARPLLRLAAEASKCDPGDPTAVVGTARCRPVLVALTATGEAVGSRFDLDDEDRVNPVVAQRLQAAKRGHLVETSAKQLADTMASHALALVDEPRQACVVFANSPSTARRISDRLEAARRKSGRDVEVLVVTGRVRDREGDRLRARLLHPAMGVGAGRERRGGRPLIVVATQTLEVGADVDFHHLVTETAGVRSLVQRLGRVNRLGTRPSASCLICHPVDGKTSPVYGEEPAQVWSTLRAMAEAEGAGPLDLSPGNVSSLLGPPRDAPPRVAELLPAHLWEWAKTTTVASDEAPVELFFDGLERTGEVALVWRAHRPADGLRLVPAVVASEAVDVPVSEARSVLDGRDVRRLAGDRASLETVAASALRPGDVVVLAPADGLYDELGWNPSAGEPVLDVSPLRSGVLLLSEAVLDNLSPGVVASAGPSLHALLEPPLDDELDDAGPLGDLLGLLRSSTPHPWLDVAERQAFLDGLGTVVARPVDDVPSVAPRPSDRRWATVAVRADAFEELSFTASSHVLSDHLGAVGEVAARIAVQLGLAAPLVDAVRLAGEWHDLGKRDPRFQRWLDPDAESPAPLGKSRLDRTQMERARVAAGWPRGGRHELLSSRLVSAWLQEAVVDCDTELVLHLVASHHGFGRPLVRVVDDPAPTRLVAAIDGRHVTVSGDLGMPDWSQPQRFRHCCERYGVWGLALLEAIVRQADHAASQIAELT
jgi:CRISPR-associated endonuclease/helicase Cas3